MDYLDPSHYRMLAAGDLNLCYGATEAPWYARERVVWDRSKALGLKFSGATKFRTEEQLHPHLRTAPRTHGTFPTWHSNRQRPVEANRQLNYAFASRGLHEDVDGSCPQWCGGNGGRRPLPPAD